jgi:diguanylate cyclase (GGDEF)-like protein
VTAVCLIGIPVIAYAFIGGGRAFGKSVLDSPFPFAACAVLVVVAELNPIRLIRSGAPISICASTTFAFALLLSHGLAAAIMVQGVASVVADVRQRKQPLKVAFNVAQYSLSLWAPAIVLALFYRTRPFGGSHAGDSRGLIAILFAGIAYYLVNNALVAVVVALAEGAAVVRFSKEELTFQASTSGLLLGLAPIVVVVGQREPVLLPLMLLPVLAVYVSARDSVVRHHQALHDGLTGMANRDLYRDGVTRAIEDAKPDRFQAVMLIDLDRFKEVNDTLGHHTGDQLLCEVGPRLEERLPEIDLIARLGGDEFAVLVRDLEHVEEATALARQIASALEQPFAIGDLLNLEVEASIGIALHPLHGDDVETLLQRADVAMYLAKEAHTVTELYSRERDHNSTQRLAMLGDLRVGISSGQLVLHYQPKLDVQAGRVCGAEALVRWEHPTRGLIPPDDFIPLSEHSGLIEPLTAFVLEEAISQWREWANDGFETQLSVNLSARNLHDLTLPERITELMTRYEMPMASLQIELTESAVMQDMARALRILETLDAMGIDLCIDDFGTGYSSLGRLKRLPVRELKIDRSFISQIEWDENDAAIVRSTVELAHRLGLDVTAEGVESFAALELLTSFGCRYVQGHLVGRAVPSADFLKHPLLPHRASAGAAGLAQALRSAKGVAGVEGVDEAAVPPEPGPQRLASLPRVG